MKNLKILYFIAIVGSIYTINASESSTDKLKSFRTKINDCDKPDFALSKIYGHFNEDDYRTITVNQMKATLNLSINDLNCKKKKFFCNSWCNNCQMALDMNEKSLKEIERTNILFGGNISLDTHDKFKKIKKEAIGFAVNNPGTTMYIIGTIGSALLKAEYEYQSSKTVPTNDVNSSNNPNTENS